MITFMHWLFRPSYPWLVAGILMSIALVETILLPTAFSLGILAGWGAIGYDLRKQELIKQERLLRRLGQ